MGTGGTTGDLAASSEQRRAAARSVREHMDRISRHQREIARHALPILATQPAGLRSDQLVDPLKRAGVHATPRQIATALTNHSPALCVKVGGHRNVWVHPDHHQDALHYRKERRERYTPSLQEANA